MRDRQVRSGRLRHSMLCAIVLSIVVAVQAGPLEQRSKACEPAAELDVSARLLRRVPLGATERVTVELVVQSPHAPEVVHVRAALSDRHDREATVQLPEQAMALDARSTARYTIELPRGREHHLLLAVRSQGSGESVLESSAYVRINLDPALEPEVRERVIQYRARMGSPAVR